MPEGKLNRKGNPGEVRLHSSKSRDSYTGIREGKIPYRIISNI